MILVIGYGNSLCGDDGIGPYVVEQLAQAETDAQSSTEIEYLVLRQLTPELAEPISRADSVIFVDAVVNDLPPGFILCSELKPVARPFETNPSAFTHHIKATVLLENARFLYGKQPVTWLYTVTGKNFNLGDPFSPAVESALPELVSQLKVRITQCMSLVSSK
jgi:hydrogenase maturation protease